MKDILIRTLDMTSRARVVYTSASNVSSASTV